MQFVYDGNLYKVVKITGPSHNFLGLELKNHAHNQLPEIKDIDFEKNNSNQSQLNDITKQVLEGVRQANKELLVNFIVTKIEFSSKDTPSQIIYCELTKEIIKRIVSGGVFK